MEKYKLTDYQWKLIEPLIPPKTSTCGRARHDPRELINGIVWVLKTGSPLCALPEEYGSWHTIYNNFRMIICSFILSYNNIQFDTFSSNINMELNEVISGNLDYSLTLQGEEYESLVAVKYMYGYGESDGIAFLKSDNSLWIKDIFENTQRNY